MAPEQLITICFIRQLRETAFMLAMKKDTSNYESLLSEYELEHEDSDNDSQLDDSASYPKIRYMLATPLVLRGAIVTEIIYPV